MKGRKNTFHPQIILRASRLIWGRTTLRKNIVLSLGPNAAKQEFVSTAVQLQDLFFVAGEKRALRKNSGDYVPTKM